jgi:hypothetical protein
MQRRLPAVFVGDGNTRSVSESHSHRLEPPDSNAERDTQYYAE